MTLVLVLAAIIISLGLVFFTLALPAIGPVAVAAIGMVGLVVSTAIGAIATVMCKRL